MNTLSPYIQILLILAVLWYATTQYCVDRERRRWRKKFEEESARRESAEAANIAKAFFLTSMSHEIRAPLNAIVDFIELALKSPLSQELRESLATVRTSADWLGHVVKEVLDFSRIDAGAFRLCSESFSVRETVCSAIKIAQPLADERKIPLRLHMDAALPAMVQGDSARLLQVLFNLIENALKYTTSGSVLVTVAVEKSSKDLVTVQISVADTGMGISPERIPHLFEPLATPASALDRRARTCGFGLPICQRVVQMMGGEIQVLSRPGVGSTFSFSLELPLIAERKHAEKNESSYSEARRPLGILVVERDAANRQLASAFLQGAGHDMAETGGASEALNLLATS